MPGAARRDRRRLPDAQAAVDSRVRLREPTHYPYHRWLGALAVALLTILVGPGDAAGVTYAVRVRWMPSPSAGVQGYLVTVSALSGPSPPVLDAGLPPAASDGTLAAQVSGLDGRTDYIVTVTAYAADGSDSTPSNAIAVGYARVAGRIDSDGDGLSDAAEDVNLNRAVDPGETNALSADTDGDRVGDAADRCQDTAAGVAVNASGCSCAQIRCDDGNACTADSCSAGSCRYQALPDGSACSNGNACDGSETCRSGVCTAGVPLDCDDGNPCTTDRCTPQGGCAHYPGLGCCAPEGGPCDDGDACTTGDTCRGDLCTGTISAPARGPRGVGVRRFLLYRTGIEFGVTASGTFAFPQGVDLATSGMRVVFEDGAHESILAVSLSGADLLATRSGWILETKDNAFDRLEVRPKGDTARVSLRGTLPAFPLAGDAPTSASGSGTIYWRVSFGSVCSGVLELACTEDANGRRRCREP